MNKIEIKKCYFKQIKEIIVKNKIKCFAIACV